MKAKAVQQLLPPEVLARLSPELQAQWRKAISPETIQALAKLSAPEHQKEVQIQSQALIEKRKQEGTWTGGIQAHTAYQKKPVEWIVKYLGVPENTIRWSLNPEYQNCSCDTEICNSKTREATSGAHVWDGDRDPLVLALETIAAGGNVAVSAATGTSKTFTLAACGGLWFLACFENAIVPTLAPREDQLLLNMWKEMGKMFAKFNRLFPAATMVSGKLRMLDGEGDKEVWAATAVTAGVDADEDIAQRLKGIHGADMFWVIEELPGVVPAKLKTIINTATGTHNPIMGLGNPESQHDTLAQFAARPSVRAIRISAYDYPNVVAKRDIVPGAVSTKSIAERLEDASGDTTDPMFLSQVRGIAPSQSRRAMIRWDWCEEAAKKWGDEKLRAGPLALGVDVADSPTGDRSAISRWQGAVCTEVETFHAEDASEVGRIVHAEITNPDAPIDPRYVGIDAVGVGASAVNELKRLGTRVRLISGGMRAIPSVDHEALWAETREEDGKVRPAGPTVVEAERYANQRSAVLWRLREDMRLGRIGLPNDRRLFEELTVLEYELQNGKIAVVEKKKIRALLGRSPDASDAVAYGNYARRRAPLRTKSEGKPLVNAPGIDRGLERLLATRQKQQLAEDKRIRRMLGNRARAKRR